MTQALRTFILASAAFIALSLPTLAVHQFDLLPPVASIGEHEEVQAEQSQPQTLLQAQTVPQPQRKSASAKQLAAFVARTYQVPYELATQIVRQAVYSANRHGLEPTLVLGVIAQESSFDKTATSRVGAQGLMQVMPDVHAELAARLLTQEETLYDVAPNVKTGTHILAAYLREARGDVSKALRRYSGGATDYDAKVLRKKETFDRFFPAKI